MLLFQNPEQKVRSTPCIYYLFDSTWILNSVQPEASKSDWSCASGCSCEGSGNGILKGPTCISWLCFNQNVTCCITCFDFIFSSCSSIVILTRHHRQQQQTSQRHQGKSAVVFYLSSGCCLALFLSKKPRSCSVPQNCTWSEDVSLLLMTNCRFLLIYQVINIMECKWKPRGLAWMKKKKRASNQRLKKANSGNKAERKQHHDIHSSWRVQLCLTVTTCRDLV